MSSLDLSRTSYHNTPTKCFYSSSIPKNRDYKERQVDRKKRKAIRPCFVSVRHGRHVLSQCPKQRQSPPGNIKKGLLIPGGMLLFRALANNMAPMTNADESPTNRLTLF